MDRGLEWYKRDPRAMIDAKRAANGGLGLTMRQAAVFDLVIDLIYEGAGQTPNSPRYFASHFQDMGIRAAREAVQSLIDMGKLNEKDGMIYSNRATEQAKSRKQVSETRAKSGQKGGKNSAKTRQKLKNSNESPEIFDPEKDEFVIEKSNKNNKTTQANASSKIQPEKRREEKKQKPRHSGAKSERNSDSMPLFGGQLKSEPIDDRFDEFWDAYPHRGGAKKGKTAARKKWDAAIKRKVDPGVIIAGAIDFQRDRKAVDGYAPDPARWLFNEMWLDEIEEVKGQDNGNSTYNGRASHGGRMDGDAKATEIADRAARITASQEAERRAGGDVGGGIG